MYLGAVGIASGELSTVKDSLAFSLSLSRSLSEIPYHPSSSELNSPIKQVVRGSLADKGYPKMDFSLRL